MKALSGFYAAFKHELITYKTSPGVWLFVVLCLMSMAVSTFYVGSILQTETAHLKPFFTYHPWIYLFFIPALVMGHWANEWRHRTIERLLTLPITLLGVTLAKFLASWLVVGVVLICTLPLVASIHYLGDVEWPVVAASYLGSFLVAGIFLSVSLMASMFTRSQAGSFSLSVVVLVFLLSMGWGFARVVLEGVAVPVEVLNFFSWFSLLGRYHHFVVGMVDVRDVVFLLSLILLFVSVQHGLLFARTARKRKVWVALPALILVILLNVAIAPVRMVFDATEDKLHTFHENSASVLQSLEEEVEVTFYFSEGNTSMPAAVYRYGLFIRDYLEQVRDFNASHIRLRYVNPDNSIDLEIEAQNRGVGEIATSSGDGYYFGVAMKRGDRVGVLPALHPQRQRFLEYDIVNGLASLQDEKRPVVYVMTRLDIGGQDRVPPVLKELNALYDVRLSTRKVDVIPKDVDMVMVLHAPFIYEENIYAIDQFVMRGGKAVFVLDPFVRSASMQDQTFVDRKADAMNVDHVADLLRAWGVEYDYNRIVGSESLGMPVNVEGVGEVYYPLWLDLQERHINNKLPFAENLYELHFLETGYFTGENIVPFVQTGHTGQTVSRTLLNGSDLLNVADQLAGEREDKILAGMIMGGFGSAFDEGVDHISQTEADAAVAFFADSDFIHPKYALSRKGKMMNDNWILFLNTVQYMMGNKNLLGLEGRTVKPQPFTRVEQLLAEGRQKYAHTERMLLEKLDAVAADLKLETDDENIAEFQYQQLQAKKSLKELRKQVNAEMDKLAKCVVWFNVLLVPLCVVLLGMVYFFLRKKRSRR